MSERCVVHLARPVADVERWQFLLDDGELARAERFRREEDRARFVTGRVVAKMALTEVLDVAPNDVTFTLHCAVCDDSRDEPHGKPAVAGAEFSIAHSGELVAVAVASVPVGVDVELINSRTDVASMAPTVLSSAERAALAAQDERQAFFTYWARKESILKATGRGLSVELNTVDVADIAAPLPRPDGPGRVAVADLDLSDYAAHEDYRGAVAVLSDSPVTVDYTHFAG
jgi:4'-phosphopantetheinyl transferase